MKFKLLPGRSIKTQLTAAIFSLTALAIVIVSVIAVHALLSSGSESSNIAATAMRDRVQQFLVQTTTATAAKNSVIFNDIENEVVNATFFTKNILDNPSTFPSTWKFDTKMTRASNGEYGNSASEPGAAWVFNTPTLTARIKKSMELLDYTKYLYPKILEKEPNGVAIYYVGDEGDSWYYPNIPLTQIVDASFDARTQEFFTAANPQNDPKGEFRWSKVYDDPAGNGLVITAANPMYTNNQFLGEVEIDVTLNNIAKNIEDYSPIESSYAFLIDNEGRAVAFPTQAYHDFLNRAPKKGEFGASIASVKGDLGAIVTAMRAGKEGFSSAEVGGVGVYAAYAPVAGTPFSLAIIARQPAALKVVDALQTQVQASTTRVIYSQLLPLGAGVILAVWLIGVVYVRFLIRPLNQLNEKTAEVARGNLDVEPTVVNIDNEVGQLAHSFNDMVSDLRASRDKIEEQNQALLHSEQTRLRASIDSLRIGFIMTDTSNSIFLLNDAAKTILGESIGHKPSLSDISKLLGPTADLATKLQHAVDTDRSVEIREITLNDRILHIFIAPILEKTKGEETRKLGAVILIEDITEAKNVEHTKDEFFSIASHELRTPLTAIRGNASMIEQFYTDQMKTPGLQEMVTDIHESSVRLIGIVNDFLDASRLEQGKVVFKPAPFAVKDTLDAVIQEMSGVLSERHLYLKKDASIDRLSLVMADKDRVKQIFYNLIGNSLKFVEKGGVTVSGEAHGSVIKILISDTGRGMAPEVKRMLFQKFRTSANSLSHDGAQGTGLGLYISRLMMEQMGGVVSLESSVVGKGSVFSFTIPIAKDGQIAEPKSEAKA